MNDMDLDHLAAAALGAVHDTMKEWGDVPWPEHGSEDDAVLWSAIRDALSQAAKAK